MTEIKLDPLVEKRISEVIDFITEATGTQGMDFLLQRVQDIPEKDYENFGDESDDNDGFIKFSSEINTDTDLEQTVYYAVLPLRLKDGIYITVVLGTSKRE